MPVYVAIGDILACTTYHMAIREKCLRKAKKSFFPSLPMTAMRTPTDTMMKTPAMSSMGIPPESSSSSSQTLNFIRRLDVKN